MGSYLSMQHVPKTFRPKILKRLRREVWIKRNGQQLNGTCWCCARLIEYEQFECGHVISVFNGGPTKLSNLEPICTECNREMGVENMGDFNERLKWSLND